MSTALLFPLLVARQLAASPPLPAEPVQIDADQVTYGTGVARATGHVTVRAPGLVLHAPALVEDIVHRRLSIAGPLFAIDGTNVLVARRASVDLDGGQVDLFDVRLYQKERTSPAALAAARTPDEAAAVGIDRAIVGGKHIARIGPGHYRIDGVDLTTCQCGPDCTPAWSLSAGRADVEAGERAWLSWPVFRVDGVPVLPLPALYFPLADRRTGFLLPHFAWQSQNGAIIDEPFFLTLGPSYDVTLSAGYVTGASENGLGANGVRGPRASGEFRYAPSQDTAGRLFLSVLDDRNHDFVDGVGYVRGPRESLHFWQVQGDEGRLGDRVDISLVSDARLTSQLTTDILFASIPATRSAATAFWRGDDLLLSGDAVYYQDFQGAFTAGNVHQDLFGPGSPSTLATAPRLQADLADRRLGPTPLWFSLASSATHEGAIGHAYDAVTLGLPQALLRQDAMSNTPPIYPWQPGRTPADRLDLLPTVSWPIDLGRFATASVQAAWREDLWYFEGDTQPGGPSLGQSGQRGYPLLDAQIGTQLSRTWTSGWSHSIAPELLLRAIPTLEATGLVPPLWLSPASGAVYDHATGFPIASLLPLPYDEIDFAPGYGAPPAPGSPGTLLRGPLPTGLAQAELHVDQRLRGPNASAHLDLGEYLDPGGPEGTFGLLESRFGPFHANAYALVANQPLPCPAPTCTPSEHALRRLEEATADVGWGDARGDGAGVSFVRALAGGSMRMDAPLDALFAPPLPPEDPRWALPDVSQASANATVAVADGVAVHGGLTYLVSALQPIQLLAGAGWKSSQGCLALDGNLVFQPPAPGSPLGLAAFFVTFDLGELGGGTL